MSQIQHLLTVGRQRLPLEGKLSAKQTDEVKALRQHLLAVSRNWLPLWEQRRRPRPAAETGRSCWGRGQQDASAAQGTKRMLGAATRRCHRR